MGSVGSVQCHIVPCSGFTCSGFTCSQGLQVSLKHTVSSIKYRVLICCICHFQSCSPFFVYFGFLFLQVSSVSNFHSDTRGQRWPLVQLTCSVVLWGGRDTAKKYHWCVWGVFTVDGPHWVCHSPGWNVFPGSTTAQAPGCSAWALFQVGPEFHAVPRTKAFWF